MGFEIGKLYFTTSGIAEVLAMEPEDGVEKARLIMHLVSPRDGVTPNGNRTRMSMRPETLQMLVNDFPRSMAERKRSIGNVNEDWAREAMAEIIQAEIKGPKV